MSENRIKEAYVDYFYSDQFIEFCDGGVQAVQPFVGVLEEFQCWFQRFEIRWDGDKALQEFSVTKDGIAVLLNRHDHSDLDLEEVIEWASLRIKALVEEFDDQQPKYLILEREQKMDIGQHTVVSRIYWDGHNSFSADLGWHLSEREQEQYWEQVPMGSSYGQARREAVDVQYDLLTHGNFACYDEMYFEAADCHLLTYDEEQESSIYVTADGHTFDEILLRLHDLLGTFDDCGLDARNVGDFRRGEDQEDAYVDYYPSDLFVEFLGDRVRYLVPFEQKAGEAQLTYQRIELRWDGHHAVQEFSVTKDGIAILIDTHSVKTDVHQWADDYVNAQASQLMHEKPSYLVSWRRCNGPDYNGRTGTDRVYWNGHDCFRFHLANDVLDLNEHDPERFHLPFDGGGVPELEGKYLNGDIAGIAEGCIRKVDEDFPDQAGDVDLDFEDQPGTVDDEKPRSQFVDSMERLISQLHGALEVGDITISEAELAELEADRELERQAAKRRHEILFLYRARNRLIICLMLAPVSWIYVRSALERFDMPELHYGFSVVAGLVVWLAWQSFLVAMSFRKNAEGKSNLRIARRRLREFAIKKGASR